MLMLTSLMPKPIVGVVPCLNHSRYSSEQANASKWVHQCWYPVRWQLYNPELHLSRKCSNHFVNESAFKHVPQAVALVLPAEPAWEHLLTVEAGRCAPSIADCLKHG